MSQSQLLKTLVKSLEDNHIPYVLTGSIVSSLLGEPRLTHDIDVMIHIHQRQIDKILKAFPSFEYYIDKESISEAIAHKSMFNVISSQSGDKIDFYILPDNDFETSRFARKQRVTILDFEAFIPTPEDVILAKLHWSKLSGGSEKQFNDALRVYEVQFEILDQQYLHEWAQYLDVRESLEKLKSKAKTI